MQNRNPEDSTTRRGALSSVLAVVAGGSLARAGVPPSHPITSASVLEDPDAPAPQQGTQPEKAAFQEVGPFERHAAPQAVAAFDLRDVQLSPGPFLDAQNANHAFLAAFPAERLLRTFRLNAGLSSNSVPLGGWEKPEGELRGHFTGHFLSACALMYRTTGDAALKTKGDFLVSELARCQERLNGGYLSAFPLEFFDRLAARKSVWAPFYTVHKIMAGMLDMYLYCGNEQALKVLTRQAEWADRWTSALSAGQMQMVLDTEYGGMNETLYNLAAVSGEARWGSAGDRFTKQRFFNPLAERQDLLRGLHANTHIPQVIGAARRYELTSDRRFQTVADFFWSEVTEARTYASGGTSNNEGWLVGPHQLAKELSLGTDTNECCCAYNMLKLTRHLYTRSADPRFFDYYERVLLNHRLGTIDRNGFTQYYLGIVPGSWRTFGTEFDTFWCCNGTGAEEFSTLNSSIYFHDRESVYINLFIPSTLHWEEKGLRLRQETRFPEQAGTSFVVEMRSPSALTLHIRVPGWLSASPAVRINGEPLASSARPGSYLSLSRTWKTGDRVHFALPMSLRAEPMPDDSSLQAFLYGPILLAGIVPGQVSNELVAGRMGPDFKKLRRPELPVVQTRGERIESWMRPASAPLRFETSADAERVSFAPFWQTSGQRYSIYWRVT